MIEDQVLSDLKQALQNGDAVAVSVLRLLKSELHNARIAAGAELDEAERLKVVRKEAKKRTEAAAMYRQAGQEERAATEEAEAAVLQRYLPAAADPAKVEAFARDVLAELPDRSPRQKGVLIQRLRAEFGEALDGSQAAAIASRLLDS